MLLCFVSGCGSSPQIPVRSISQDGIDDVSSAVVALIAPEEEGDPDLSQPHEIFCTGEFVGRYEVLTAAHCINDVGLSGAVRVGTYQDWRDTDGDFHGRNWSTFRVVRIDYLNDLALLRVQLNERDTLSAHNVLDLASRPVTTGENVVICGHPLGLAYTFTVGVVSRGIRLDSGEDGVIMFIQHQAPVFYGNSGGPILNMDGELVGVVSRMARTPHLGLGIHLNTVRTFLGR